jgi:uncharacterized membrane protein YdjX (TVP38/TMEM64 family)
MKIDNTSTNNTAYIVCGVVVAALLAFFVYRAIIKKKRNSY